MRPKGHIQKRNDRHVRPLDREIKHAAVERVELMEKVPHRAAALRAIWLPDSDGYTRRMPKVLISLPETDLRAIDAAARKAGETRSAFLRRAALAEARRVVRPIDDPEVPGL